MYQITCDGYVLYDHRDEDLVVLNPKCKLKVNTVGEASFTMLNSHPYYGVLKKLKSVFEIKQDNQPIFRGRMTADSRDFHNQYLVDLEGVLAFTNDSIVDPFKFPEDFPEAANATNVVEYFLKWLIEDVHNGQVEDWQKLKVGTVTVTDPSNYITRSSEEYLSTWEALKSKLFDSTLGGYLCIRYEEDGNYVDYLSTFPLTNTQTIRLGENMLDFQNRSDASETYSAIIPIGGEVVVSDGNDYEGEFVTIVNEVKKRLTLETLEDGDLTDDLVKKGKFIYSKSAVESYGWICAPIEYSTWDDVTVAETLKNKAIKYLTGSGMLLDNTITIKAVDLHFTDDQIQAFRVYRNILVDSPVHGVSGVSYPLMELDIDLFNPQNTTITIGETSRTLIDINADRENNADALIQSTKKDLKDYVSNLTKQLANKIEGIDGLFFYIKYSQYADGHVMTDVPDDSTQYIGTCSTNADTAPTDYREYTWCKIRGKDGTPGKDGDDGKTQYLHIKYSNDGETFTGNNGEDLGAWIGTLVDFVKDDSTNFDDYTWKKFTEDVDIGGRNLLQKSNPADWLDDWIKWQNTTATLEGAWLHVVKGESDTRYGYYPPKISTFPVGDLLLSFDAYSDAVMALDYNYIMADSGNKMIGTVNITTEPTRYVIPFTLTAETANCSIMIGSTSGNSFFIKDIKVETGNVPTDWTPAPEDTSAAVDSSADFLRQTIIEQNTAVLNNAQSIILTALERYVETSNYDEFKQTVESQLEIMADQISMNFTSTTEQITEVDGDLQAVITNLSKHFDFSLDGLTIKAGENSMNLLLDNDLIRFMKNGKQFGWWDGVDFHTGNIVVEVNERAQFGNFAFVPRSDGSLMFLKVGE